MLEKIRQGEFQGIVCFRFDRLGRNAKDLLQFFEEMENKGVEIMSINENLDTSTPVGRAVRDILIRLCQLERENIAEATKQRLHALRDAGMKLGRPKGSKDTKNRRKSGYYARWQREKQQ